MIVTLEFLNRQKSCRELIEYINYNNLIGKDIIEVLNYLYNDNNLNLVARGIVHLLSPEQCVKYSVYIAKSCVDLIKNKKLKKWPKWQSKKPKNLELMNFHKILLKKNYKSINNESWFLPNAVWAAMEAIKAAINVNECPSINAYNSIVYAYREFSEQQIQDGKIKDLIKYGITLLEENNDSYTEIIKKD